MTCAGRRPVHVTRLGQQDVTDDSEGDQMALWSGRFEGGVSEFTQEFGASLPQDKAMYAQDIQGSIAHARMLARQGIILEGDAEKIVSGLEAIKESMDAGEFEWNVDDEDIHMAVESKLTSDVGEAGARLHTGRSRNDQVALDLRLYAKDQIKSLMDENCRLRASLLSAAEKNLGVVMPGYTHLQHAQPVLFSHHLLAYFWMLTRDFHRLAEARSAADANPLGAAALAGTTYDLDRFYTTELLGMDHPIPNSMDAVSDRDYLLDLLYACSVSMMHLSRLCEEVILWSTTEFSFITLSDAYSTGSSIMPQKKNPDFAELTRGKTGRVVGDLVSLLVTMKGLPLAYNKDLQEDKEPIFDAIDTVRDTLHAFIEMMPGVEPQRDVLREACHAGYPTATDLADYLVRKGVPFRSAHDIVGQIVRAAVEMKCGLHEMPLEKLQSFSDKIGEDVYDSLTLEGALKARNHTGGTAPAQVLRQVGLWKDLFARREKDPSAGEYSK